MVNEKKFSALMLFSISLLITLGIFVLQKEEVKADRIILDNGNLYSISNTLGEKAITENNNIEILFDQKNGMILFGKGWEKALPESERIGGTNLYILNNKKEIKLTDQLVTKALFDKTSAKIYYTTENYDLFSINNDGSNNTKIGEKALGIDLSPDGKYMVYQKLNSNWIQGDYYEQAIGMTVLDLEKKKEKKIGDKYEDWGFVWTPDSKKILFFSASPSGLASHHIIDINGKNRKQLTNNGMKHFSSKTMPTPSEKPIWSSNGKYLIYESDKSIWINEFNGGYNKIKESRMLSYGRDPHWIVDGKTVGVVMNKSSKAKERIIQVNLDGKIIK